MQTKIYLNEWFLNAGIVGFMRILKHNNKDSILNIKENYIEFDSQNLKDFNKYYFNYFFDKYNVANKMKIRISNSFNKIRNYIEDEKAESKDKLKIEKKNIKTSLKAQLDKIKKIDEDAYNFILDYYKKIEIIKTNEDLTLLEEIENNLIKVFEKENINKKMTLNLFKSILSNTYFGQPSFLNVVKSSLPYNEQEKLMYKDYISNIIESDFLHEIFNENYELENLKEILKRKIDDGLITKEFKKIYSNLDNKFIKKGKTIEELKSYIKNNVLETCSICGQSHELTDIYTEANFVPLALSSENMSNFFWNQNVSFPICDICKLILFCIPAGVTNITKTIKDNNTYKEKEVLSFVNFDSKVTELLNINDNLADNSKRERMNYNPYGELVLNIVEQNKKLNLWQLENIFVIEFEAEYLSFSRLEYFNIKRNVAKLFIKYSYLLNNIRDYTYKLQIIDYILKNKDITSAINARLREKISKGIGYSEDSFNATKIKYILEILKKEDINVEEEVKNANKISYKMFMLGSEIHTKLKKDRNENKLDGYIYKMLNCIKTNNKNEFIDIAIRILWSSGKDIPNILVRNNENISWQELGHSFIAGLTSNGVNNNNEEVNEDGNE